MMNFGTLAIVGAGIYGFGDSFSVGGGASIQTNGFSYLLAAKLGGGFTNLAVSGTRTAAAAKAAMGSLPVIRKSAVVMMSGFNDILTGGSVASIQSNTRALIAASFLKENIPASAMRRSGAWTVLGADGGRANFIGGTALYSTDPNAYLEWDFFGETLVVGSYTTGTGGTYKDFNVSIDGGAPSTFAAYGMTSEVYPVTGLNALVLQNLGFGKHTVRLSQKTGAGVYIVVDYVGALAEPGATGSTFIGQIPSMVNWSYNGLTINQGIEDAANAGIASVVDEFAGWPVQLVPVNDFYTPDATHTAPDGEHPTDAGHVQIMTAFWSRMSPSF
jgi:hypothetical protein